MLVLTPFFTDQHPVSFILSAPKKVRKKSSNDSLKSDLRPGTPMTSQHDSHPDLHYGAESEKIARDSLTKEQKKFLKPRHQSESDFDPLGKENIVYKNNHNRAHHKAEPVQTNRLVVHAGDTSNVSKSKDSKKRVMVLDVTTLDNREPESSSHDYKPTQTPGKILKPFKLSKSSHSIVTDTDNKCADNSKSEVNEDTSQSSPKHHISSQSGGLVTSQSLTVASTHNHLQQSPTQQHKANKVTFSSSGTNHQYQRSEFDFRWVAL